MEQDKKFSAKEAAVAVLKKTEELLKKSNALKKAINEQEHMKAPANKVSEQVAPEKNPHENAENGNPAPGAFPQNQEKFGAELKGHIKLAKFMGRMEHKKGKKEEPMEKAIGDKTSEGLVVLKEPKKEEKVQAHLVGDKEAGLHPKSQIGSAIPKDPKAK